MTDCIVLVNAKMKLNYRDLSDSVRSVMKTKHDNDLTDCTSAFYFENDTELS